MIWQVAGTVRNCCFEADTELPSLLLTSQFLWPALLLPLAGQAVRLEPAKSLQWTTKTFLNEETDQLGGQTVLSSRVSWTTGHRA